MSSARDAAQHCPSRALAWCKNRCCDAERLARLEREAQSLKRVGDEIFRVEQRVDSERSAREATLGKLQSELQQLLGMCRVSVTGSSALCVMCREANRQLSISQCQQLLHKHTCPATDDLTIDSMLHRTLHCQNCPDPCKGCAYWLQHTYTAYVQYTCISCSQFHDVCWGIQATAGRACFIFKECVATNNQPLCLQVGHT